MSYDEVSVGAYCRLQSQVLFASGVGPACAVPAAMGLGRIRVCAARPVQHSRAGGARLRQGLLHTSQILPEGQEQKHTRVHGFQDDHGLPGNTIHEL